VCAVGCVEGEGWRTLLDFFGVEMGMHCGFARGVLFARVDGARFGRLEGGGAGLDRTGTWRC